MSIHDHDRLITLLSMAGLILILLGCVISRGLHKAKLLRMIIHLYKADKQLDNALYRGVYEHD